MKFELLTNDSKYYNSKIIMIQCFIKTVEILEKINL